MIKLEAIVPPQQKSFESAMSEIAPAYQDALQKRLTENWLSGVRSRHAVTYNTKAIDAVWSSNKTAKKLKK
jgi:hypothetical protein